MMLRLFLPLELLCILVFVPFASGFLVSRGCWLLASVGSSISSPNVSQFALGSDVTSTQQRHDRVPKIVIFGKESITDAIF